MEDFFKASPGASPGGQCVQENKPEEERIMKHMTGTPSLALSAHILESVLYQRKKKIYKESK